MSHPQVSEGAIVPSKPPAKLQGVWLYLAILATVYVVASLVLGVVSYTATQEQCPQDRAATDRHER